MWAMWALRALRALWALRTLRALRTLAVLHNIVQDDPDIHAPINLLCNIIGMLMNHYIYLVHGEGHLSIILSIIEHVLENLDNVISLRL
jgi:hypothetical protein